MSVELTAEFRTDFNLLDKSEPIATPTAVRDFHSAAEADGGNGDVVAIRDSGIDATHPVFEHFGVDVKKPDIDGLPTDGQDAVGHGTMVASMVALGAPNVDTLVSVPIFGSSGRTGLDRIMRSYDYLTGRADHIDYVNDSWGARRKIPQIDQRHNELEQAGVDSIVAAGNTDQTTGSPATASRAWAVAGCRLDGRMTRFSSPTDDIAAVALNVAGAKSRDANMGEPVPDDAYCPVMKEIGGEWNYAPGTSFGAPWAAGYGVSYQTEYVSSAVAAEPDESRAFEAAFNNTATEITGTDEDGQGYINFARAVDEGIKRPPEANPSGTANVWTFAGGVGVWHDTQWLSRGEYDTELLEQSDEGTTIRYTDSG